MMLQIVRTYASLVKFSHTVFALPFALTGYFYGVQTAGFSWPVLLKIVLCMVFARNAAMGFNRWADRCIDAANPRTAAREIPRGAIPAKNALGFVIVNALLFVAAALWINTLCGLLAPVALIIILGYSLTKRFSWLCHLFLGLALAIAPAGAYLAATGTLTRTPLLLAALVMTWTAGFDVIYSLQDLDFDRRNGLNSLPVRLGAFGALAVSAGLHLIAAALALVLVPAFGGGLSVRLGTGIFIVLLVYQHVIVGPGRLERVNLAFGTMNGVASIAYAVFVITGMYFS